MKSASVGVGQLQSSQFILKGLPIRNASQLSRMTQLHHTLRQSRRWSLDTELLCIFASGSLWRPIVCASPKAIPLQYQVCIISLVSQNQKLIKRADWMRTVLSSSPLRWNKDFARFKNDSFICTFVTNPESRTTQSAT